MSNRRSPLRQQKVLGMKEIIRRQNREIAYLRGMCESLQAQLSATRMERPADLDEWIDQILPDMDDEERAEWEAMTDDEREAFKDALGVQVNTTKLLAT